MRVLLIVPRFVARPGEFYQFPLGLAYIASALEQSGHDVIGLNLNETADPIAELVEKEVRTHNPDVCATGALSPFLPGVQEIFTASRKAKPSIVNVAGGGVVSSDPEVAPTIMDIDIGVIGEGEETIVDVLEKLSTEQSLDGVLGIVYRKKDSSISLNKYRPAVMDLTKIARPNYSVLGYDKHLHLQKPLDHHFLQIQEDNQPRAIDIITSRSCPYSCTFCFHPLGKVYRERPLDDVFDELDTLIEQYDINLIGIIDELFSLRKARLLEFCERIKKYNQRWMIQLHVNSATDITLDALRDAGCVYISYGVESMAQPVLDSMMKKSKKARIHESLQKTFERRIGIQGNLIFGDAAETIDTANESMAWWSENRHLPINLVRLQVYPGSPDYIAAVRDGLIKDRAGFAEELPIFMNISRMKTETMSLLTHLVWAQSQSLLKLADTSIFERKGYDALRDVPLYRIVWDCPSCGSKNNYENCALPPSEPWSFRLFCRSCFDRSDVRNHSVGRDDAPLTDYQIRELEEIREHMADKQTDIARKRLGALIGQVPNSGRIFDLKRKLSKLRGDLDAELRSAIAAVGFAPFVASYHVALAELMMRLDIFGGAKLHFQQAAVLGGLSQHSQTKISFLDQLSSDDERFGRFFPSLDPSDDNIVASTEKRSFDRKNEPAFPVFKRAENRSSVMRIR